MTIQTGAKALRARWRPGVVAPFRHNGGRASRPAGRYLAVATGLVAIVLVIMARPVPSTAGIALLFTAGRWYERTGA